MPIVISVLHLVAKGENEVFVNGEELRYRNRWREENPDNRPENDYTDATSRPLEIGVGDVVALKLRGEAVFRGCIIAFVSSDEKTHIVFPADAFRLVASGEKVDARWVDATEFAKNASRMVTESSPDGDMVKLWREHSVEGSQFIQSPEKAAWSVLAAVITEEMITSAITAQ